MWFNVHTKAQRSLPPVDTGGPRGVDLLHFRIVRFAPLILSLCLLPASLAQESLTIYAATSLTDAFEALADAFETAEPDSRAHLNFSSSSTLAAQLLAGAPADVFASANEKQMNLVVADGRIHADSVATFAHNQLVLAVPIDNPAQIESLPDLAQDGYLLVLAAQGTPIRAYTDAMLESHNSQHGDDFSARVLRNLASEESNVRQVVTRLALGEADAGIVYQTDALGDIAEKLQVIPIDAAHNQLASYPIAPLADAASAEVAAQFIAFVLSEQGRDILAQHGFCPPAILALDPPAEATPTPDSQAADELDPAEDSPCAPAPIED